MRFKAIAFSAVSLSTLALSGIVLSPPSAVAAPQILGLIATGEPVPLSCADGICTVEISSICMQQDRATPLSGTAYRPAEGTGITLTVTGTDGVRRSLPVGAEVEIASLRHFTSVRVSLPEGTVRRLGGGAATLSIGPLASIVPVPAEGDPDPISRREITEYTGPLRVIAEDAVGRHPARLEATRTLNQMINRLPENRAAGAEEIASLLKRAVKTDAPKSAAKAIGMTRRAVELCRLALQHGMTPGLRSCLSNQHDLLATGTTGDVWRALKPGS